MKKIWISYSWDDNKDNSIDFIAQELEINGLQISLDKWTISAGKRLWDQIDNFITNPDLCDGWILYATENSLKSEPCKEEYAYALSRALSSRNSDFPIIGIFPTSIDKDLIPKGIITRLFVSLEDENWSDRIRAAVEGNRPNIIRKHIAPYLITKKIIERDMETFYVVEVRPRAGLWSPCFISVPLTEKDFLMPTVLVASINDYSFTGTTVGGKCVSTDSESWMMYSAIPATPTANIYLISKAGFPSEVSFGVYATQLEASGPQFRLKLKDIQQN